MIVIVDDERRRVDILERELTRAEYDFKLITEVDAALDFIEHHAEQIDLLILDIMMPPGRSFKYEDTEDGLRTGVFFFYRVREKLPELPIIIFTNVRIEDVAEHFRHQVKYWYLEKKDYFPRQVVAKVKEIIGAPRRQR